MLCSFQHQKTRNTQHGTFVFSQTGRWYAARKFFLRATGLGGVESLIDHRAPVEDADTKTPDDLLRLSVGLEHPDDLIEDLARALA